MKKTKLIVLSLFAFGTVFVISCNTQKKVTQEEACSTPAPTYTANVKSIIETNCATEGCHSRGRGDFRVFENFKRKVEAGEVKQEVVVKKAMPPNKKLADNEIKLIDCWLKDGGKEN